jgi:hypothetical protein
VKVAKKDTERLETFLLSPMGQALLETTCGEEGDAGDSDSESEADAAPDVVDKFLATQSQVRSRNLKARSGRRLKSMIRLLGEFKPKVDAQFEGSDVSFLELASIGVPTLTEYLRMVGLFSGSSLLLKNVLSDASLMDQKMVDWMNNQFAAGQQP